MDATPRYHPGKYLLAALAWLIGWPLVFVPLFVKGVLPPEQLYTAAVSVVWGLGLMACFGAWAWRDAPAHGKPRNVAILFTAAWLLVFALAVFPYLFATRGARAGLRASLYFTGYCLACAACFVGVGMISRLFI